MTDPDAFRTHKVEIQRSGVSEEGLRYWVGVSRFGAWEVVELATGDRRWRADVMFPHGRIVLYGVSLEKIIDRAGRLRQIYARWEREDETHNL